MTQTKKIEQPVDIIVFGGTGDLSRRKLLPALYLISQSAYLPAGSRIISIARADMEIDDFRRLAEKAVQQEVTDKKATNSNLQTFLETVHYFPADAMSSAGWQSVTEFLAQHPERIRAFYLAVDSSFFAPLCQRLAENALISAQSRLVVEKPIGKDLQSSRELNNAIGSYFSESQIFRIDHYLGKETVQNLMALRFANALFEPIWDSRYIDHVQITVSEKIGIAQRAEYYNNSGAMRDMVQNHLLQLLCLVAMEPPGYFSADAVRDEKLKVLRSLRRVDIANVDSMTVRGQYASNEKTPSYLEDIGLDESRRETFIALRTEVNNWRWSGVPFYLRTGKRLAERISEIAVHFSAIPHKIFAAKVGNIFNNTLIIRLQPDEAINLHIMIKDPTTKSMRLRQIPLDMTFAETLGATHSRLPDAYERLLIDIIRGDQTLFMRRDEVEAAWQWVDPIIQAWDETAAHPYPYEIGSSGPVAALELMRRDGRQWRSLE